MMVKQFLDGVDETRGLPSTKPYTGFNRDFHGQGDDIVVWQMIDILPTE